MKVRSQLIPKASGKVFEMGCGGGINQQFYDASMVGSFSGMDPSLKGIEFARAAAAQKGWDADLRQGFGEAIPFGDASFDCVVCTYTLCSVEDPGQVLKEMRRILRTGGLLLFAEHGQAPDEGVRKWQTRIEPVWKRLAGGCHLTRPISSAVSAGGFQVEPIGACYIPKTPRWAGWMEWGAAVKTG
ncbi:MAG: class I SAM-dependent methyltransferase [Novosphingobium sp.]|uniref:class I SAM-dependent methyltransferase n=1 Tax=Novosphingobium sp. TaxID=1874826 RepID=UPI0032BAD970